MMYRTIHTVQLALRHEMVTPDVARRLASAVEVGEDTTRRALLASEDQEWTLHAEREQRRRREGEGGDCGHWCCILWSKSCACACMDH